MKRLNTIGTIIVVALLLGIVGCQMFEDSPTEIAAPDAGFSPMSDFLMGTPELDDWGAYYEEGDTFVRVDLPVAGALKVEYTTTTGWSGAIFAQTGSPVGLEIGLKEVDGVVDVVEDVCVSYVEGGSFSAMPSNVEESAKEDWIHYTRVNDNGSTSNWWPTSAGFIFSGEITTVCGVVNSEVQWDVIPGGAFDKPAGAQTGVGSAVLLADSFVHNLTPTSNYGNEGVLSVKLDNTPPNLHQRRTFLKFDLSAFSSASSATLRLYLSSVGSGPLPITVEAHQVADDSWGETAIIWNNQPTYDAAVLDTVSNILTTGQYYEWDVTAFVNAEISGDRIATICLISTTAGNETSMSFNSREAGANLPELAITP